MGLKACLQCEKEFESKRGALFCSYECQKNHLKPVNKEAEVLKELEDKLNNYCLEIIDTVHIRNHLKELKAKHGI